ncbi:MAG: cell division protein ZapA [Hydrogenophilus sp.]|nr:cell division protein ZapA [Hydrogenophilus sp.]
MDEQHVEVRLGERTYRLVCDGEDAPFLLEAARMLDERLQRAAAEGKLSGERLYLWTAFEVATEFVRAERRGGFDIGLIRRKMEDIAARLDRLIDEFGAVETRASR